MESRLIDHQILWEVSGEEMKGNTHSHHAYLVWHGHFSIYSFIHTRLIEQFYPPGPVLYVCCHIDLPYKPEHVHVVHWSRWAMSVEAPKIISDRGRFWKVREVWWWCPGSSRVRRESWLTEGYCWSWDLSDETWKPLQDSSWSGLYQPERAAKSKSCKVGLSIDTSHQASRWTYKVLLYPLDR